MRSIQLTFNYDDYIPRKTANQKIIENEFGDIFRSFVSEVETSFRETKKIYTEITPIERGRNLFPVLLNGKICGKMFMAHPLHSRILKFNRIGCVINGTVAYFKNLDKDLKPKHKETNYSLELEGNLQHVECERTEDSIIWMGYTLSDDNSRITGIYVSHFNEDERIWHLDLYDWINKNIKKIPVEKIAKVQPELKTKKENQKLK